MKKITLFALAAMLILLAGCKKENNSNNPADEPVVANQIVEAFDYAKMFYGEDSAAVVTQLVDDGWVFAGDDTTIVYSKINDHNISMQFMLQSEEGVINVIWMKLIDINENSTLLDNNAFKESVSYVGENPTIAGISMSFECVMYYAYGKAAMGDDFSDLSDVILEFGDDYIGVLWSESASRKTLLLSKYLDEKLDEVCVNITIA